MICLQEVHVTISEQEILNNINLSIHERRVGIVGANGSGKSTLTKLIKGLIKPTRGTVSVQGINVQKATGKWLTKIGYVFQDPDAQIIFPVVEDDLAFGLKNLKMDKITIKNKVDEILITYGLDKLRGKNTYTLSGGQKQLLAIAGILAMEPEIIIFDEPTTLLDLRNRNYVSQLIHSLNQPVLLVTHDLLLLQKFERVIVLEEGRIIADDIPERALKIYVESMA